LAFATFLFGGYGLVLAALALMVFGAIECPPLFFWRFEMGLRVWRDKLSQQEHASIYH